MAMYYSDDFSLAVVGGETLKDLKDEAEEAFRALKQLCDLEKPRSIKWFQTAEKKPFEHKNAEIIAEGGLCLDDECNCHGNWINWQK